jgi:hypothetical protein
MHCVDGVVSCNDNGCTTRYGFIKELTIITVYTRLILQIYVRTFTFSLRCCSVCSCFVLLLASFCFSWSILLYTFWRHWRRCFHVSLFGQSLFSLDFAGGGFMGYECIAYMTGCFLGIALHYDLFVMFILYRKEETR